METLLQAPTLWQGPQPLARSGGAPESQLLLVPSRVPPTGALREQAPGTLPAHGPQWKNPGVLLLLAAPGKACGLGGHSSRKQCEAYEDQLEGGIFEPRITPELARWTVCILKKDIGRSLENRLLDFLFCVMEDIP